MNSLYRFLISITLLFGLNACQSDQRQHARIGQIKPENQQKMTDDAVRQLAALYPPAQSTLTVRQSARDPFSPLLIEKLRTNGYAVLELPTETTVTSLSNVGQALPGQLPDAHNAGKTIALSWVIDPIQNADLIQLRLQIDQQQSLSRVYQPGPDGTLVAASHWIYKE